MSVTDPTATPADDIFDVPAGFIDRLFRLLPDRGGGR